MPIVFLDRLPVPSFRAYTTISVAILSCSVYYAAQIVKDPSWRSNATNIVIDDGNVTGNDSTTDTRTPGIHFKELLACMIQEPICLWVSKSLFRKRTLFDLVWFPVTLKFKLKVESVITLLTKSNRSRNWHSFSAIWIRESQSSPHGIASNEIFIRRIKQVLRNKNVIACRLIEAVARRV